MKITVSRETFEIFSLRHFDHIIKLFYAVVYGQFSLDPATKTSFFFWLKIKRKQKIRWTSSVWYQYWTDALTLLSLRTSTFGWNMHKQFDIVTCKICFAVVRWLCAQCEYKQFLSFFFFFVISFSVQHISFCLHTCARKICVPIERGMYTAVTHEKHYIYSLHKTP